MDDDDTSTEYLSAGQISKTFSMMCSQQIRFEAEIARLRECLSRKHPPIGDCADVPRDRQAIEVCFAEKIIALLVDRNQNKRMKERIAILQEKSQRLDALIRKYGKLQPTRCGRQEG